MKTRVLLNILIAVVLIIVTAEYSGERLGIVETLEKQSYDWRLRRGINTGNKVKDIVIADIDQDSFRELGDWPWSRDIYAKLVHNLFDDYGARLVVFTLPHPDPDDGEIRVLEKIKNNIESENFDGKDKFSFGGGDWGKSNSELSQSLDRLREELNYDKHFADAIRNRNVVLGYDFTVVGRALGDLPNTSRFVLGDGQEIEKVVLDSASRQWLFRRGFLGNLRQLMLATRGMAGHVTMEADTDSVIRRVPIFIKHAGGYYDSLPIAVLRKYSGYDNRMPLQADIAPVRSLLSIGHEISAVNLGQFRIPIDVGGHVYLRYLGGGGHSANFLTNKNAVFQYIPVSDIVNKRITSGQLAGKVVLVGSSAGLLRDLYPTPVNPLMPKVELMATLLNNIINGEVLYRSADAWFYEILVLAAVLAILSLVFVLFGPLPSFFILLVVIFGHVLFVLNSWDDNKVLAMTPMLLSAAGLFFFNAIAGFIFEWRSSRRLRDTFSQYVPPEFAKRMGHSGRKVNLEGELRELSVLFSDVRNFTTISEDLTPRDLTLLMNRMLTALSEAIHRHTGTVDKYIGDAVMAFWNAPLEDKEHAQNSVLAALDMQKTIVALSAEMVSEGHREMVLGVGIATGDANVGNMGSTLRMTYTAIGDTVNIASRLEGLTKFYKVPVLVSEATCNQCDKQLIFFRTVDMVRVKGREQPLRIYEPMGLAHLLDPGTIARLEKFEEMQAAYILGNFNDALDMLKEYQRELGDEEDNLAIIYEERLSELVAKPVPDSWDGVFTHSVK